MDDKQPQIREMKDILKRIKTIHGFKSDRECWEILEMSKTFFQEVKAGRKHVSNETALRIAAKANLSPDSVLVFIQREKSASDEVKAIWNNVLHTTSHNGYYVKL